MCFSTKKEMRVKELKAEDASIKRLDITIQTWFVASVGNYVDEILTALVM